MSFGVGDDFGVRGMIGRFHRSNALGDIGRGGANVVGELRLCTRRADDENLPGIGEGFAHFSVEHLVGRGVTAPDGVRFVMKMTRRHLRVQRDFVGAAQAEMEDPGLRMVDPYHGVKMRGHVL